MPRYFTMLVLGMKSGVQDLPDSDRTFRPKLRCVNKVQGNKAVNSF
jgi:hypothetical protein